MTCGGCGRENRQGATFCAGCGARLPASCASCAAPLADGARFCDACGAAVGDTRAPEAAAAVRKVVTILFTDLSGSTSLQERLDAETTRHVMDRIQRLLGDVVSDHEGRVVKFMGDGMMAVFGIPVLREDDAIRAVRAGAAMQESFAALATELRRDLGADIGLRVGINTGEVVVTPGTDDIVGDPVNVAARLEAAAAVGEVLLGVETGRLVRDVIPVEAVPALAMKGKELPVAAMRLAASEAQTTVAPTAFVGREADLDRLVSVFDETTRVRQARLVTVVGSPGLGKSRLAAEVATRLMDQATILEARCTPSGASSFGPIVDAARQALGLDETATEDDVRGAIRARCSHLGGDSERVAAIVAALVIGSAAGSAEQLFWAVRRLFEALAQERPVVLIVDDVHWAEPALLDLVEHIAEWARGGPVLVLALARPELRDRRPTMVEAGGPSTAVVVLGALDDSAGRSLALDLLATDELPAGLLGRALEASEGNPLFLRELLRLLVDDGVLRKIDGRWRATVDEGGIELPATIHAALAARLEQLRPAERTLLETASVIGRHFPRGALLVLLPEDVAADLDTHLDALRRRELIDAESTWWANDRLYRFHHALIRDAAYRRILKEVRADLHARYSTWLESVAELVSEQDEALGWHLEQAHGFRVELGQLYDEETGRLAERASTHLANAAKRALDRDDVASAASLLSRALLLVPVDDPRRRSLLRGHCDALIACGDTEAAALAVAELAASATTDHEAAVAELFDAQIETQRSPEALRSVAERTSRAAQVFAANGDDTGVAHAELIHATAMAALGQVAACETALDRSLAAARRSDDRRRANAVLAIAPLAALWGPSPVARASGRCLDVIRVLRITSWAPQVEAHALRAQAVLEALRDRPEASRRMIESARVTFADLGQPLGLLEVETHAGIVELLAGDPAAAEPHLRRAREGFQDLGSRVGAARATAVLARALLELDRLDEAAALADPSIGGDDLKATIGLLGVRAEVLALRGGVDEAERLARRAVEIASGTDALLDHADARLALSRVLAAAGRSGEAAAEAARARDLYEAKGSVVGVRRAGMAPTTAPVDSPPVVGRRARPNAVSRYVDEVFAAVKADDITEVARRYYTPDSIYVHHLTGEELRGDEQLLAMAEYARRREFEFVHEVLLTFGERLALYRLKIDSDEARPVGEAFDPVGSTELELVLVAELDEARKVVRTDVFPPDRLDQASALAFARHADLATDPVEARAARALSGTAAFYELVNAGAWSELEALFSPEVEAIDHRLASTHLAGRDDWISYLRSAIELAGGVRFDLSDFLAVDVRRGVALAGTRLHGHLPDAGAFDMPTYFACVVGADGLVSRVDMFDPEQHDDAFALFDELVRGPSVAAEGPAVRRRLVPNLAAASFEAWIAAVQAGDTEAVERLQGSELRPEDLFAAGLPNSVEPIAAVGRHQVVCRVHDQSICLAVTDAAGVLTEIRRFASDQLSSAMVLLVELWAEGELDGAERERALATREFWLSPNGFGRDWQAGYHALDTVVVDHRPAGWGTLHGRASVADQASALAALADDFRGELVDVYAFTADVAVTRFDVSGTRDGGVFTRPTVIVQQFGEDGLVTRSDIYAPEQTDEALALVDELTAGVAPPASAPTPTATTRLMEGPWREAMARADDTALAAASAPDIVVEDRRPSLQSRLEGRAAHVASLMLSLPRAGVDVRCESQATRGERLALVRMEYIGRHNRVEMLSVCELDDAGACLVRAVVFEPEQEDAAYAELDERAVALGGVQWAGFRVVASWAAAYGTGDLERLRDCFVPEAVIVDHRPARFGAATVDEFVDLASELFTLTESTALRIVEVPVATSGATVFRMRTTGRMDGGSFENESWASAVFDGERLGRLELFAPEGRADAEASLIGSVGSGPAPNAATRLMERWREAMVTADAEEIAAIYSPDVVAEDRRPLFQRRVDGRQAAVTAKMFVAEQSGIDVQCEPLATRGDRLMLMRTAYVGPSYRVEVLNLFEADETGKNLVRTVAFEPEQEDAAYAELDRRAIELLGPGVLHTLTVTAAYGSGDVALLRECCLPDAVIVDHRPALFGTHGVEEFLERTTSLLALTTSTTLRIIEIPIATASGGVSRLRTTGLTADGGPFESERWSVGMIRDGRLERLELFSADGRADAEARFAELTPEHNGPSPNSASRHLERWCAAITEGDADLLASLSTPDVVTIDRRRLVDSTMDAQETTLNAQWLAGRRDLELRCELLATRGDRLVLARQEYRHPLTQAEMLTIHEVTADGRLVQRGVILDLDDEDAAYAELDEREIALREGGSANLRAVSSVMAAMNRRDAEGVRAGFKSNAQMVDHRPARFGVATVDDFVSRARTLFELVDVAVYRVTEVVRTTGPVSLWRVRARGETADGGLFENEDWSVGVFRNGLLARLEQFPIEAFVEAEARFTALASDDRAPAPNAATLHFEQFVTALLAADPEALRAMCAPDIEIEDRRPIVAAPLRGVDAVVENWMFLPGRAGHRFDWEAIATRGSRLALVRAEYADDGIEPDRFAVVELMDDEVRCQRRVVFAVDDEDAAFAELDARAIDLATLASDQLLVLVPLFESVAALNQRTLDSLVFHPDATLIDHSPGGWGTLTTAEYARFVRGIYDVADEFRARVIEIPLVASPTVMFRLRVTGARDGGEFELDYWTVSTQTDGLVTRLEQFALEDRAAAEACFERLTPRPSGPVPNAASRHAERFDLALSSGDAEGLTRLFAPRSVVDDRRRLVGIKLTGASPFDSARFLAESEGLVLTSESVATRGQRLVLLRQQFVHRSRAVIEDLTVHQVDETGELLELAVTFDPEDEDGAFAELDALALEIEGDVLLPLVGTVADYNTHDVDRVGAWFHADCAFVNHAPAGWGSFTTAEYLAYCQSLFDLTDDARVRALEVASAERWGFLTRFRMSGRREGGYFEQDTWIVTGLRDGRVVRHEQFLIERRADAEACFARLERPD